MGRVGPAGATGADAERLDPRVGPYQLAKKLPTSQLPKKAKSKKAGLHNPAFLAGFKPKKLKYVLQLFWPVFFSNFFIRVGRGRRREV